MCGGASQQQTQIEAAQASFYTEMTNEYKVVFGESQGILKDLTAMFQPILDKGPNQRGFSDEERAALDTQSIEGVASNYDKAKVAVHEAQAARGGQEFLPSGQDAQLDTELGESAAALRSSEQQQITMADYDTGRKQFNAAAGVLGGVASQLDPARFASATTGAGSAAAETANQITQADNAWMGPVFGAVGGILGGAAQGWAGKVSKP